MAKKVHFLQILRFTEGYRMSTEGVPNE